MTNGRVAYLLKKFPRLSETFVLNEILGQERLGLDLHVFSRRAADDEPRHAELARLAAQVELLPSKSELDPWNLLFAGEQDPERMFSVVGKVVAEAREWQHPRFSLLLCEALYLLGRTRELGIGHVHAHFATESSVVAMILRSLGGPSYSLTAHAKDIYRSTVDPTLLARLFAQSEFVVTVCDANIAYLRERLPEASIARVRRLYNGVDLESFDTAGGERQEQLVLGVGRLVPKKGFDVLIRAVAELRDAGRAVRCTIVGEGEERAALESLIAQLKLGARVKLAGALDQAAVRSHMARATLLCQPCRIGDDGNRDALPTVLLEALSMGLPSVSTPVTGIPEILDEGRAGRLVPEGDVSATAAALAALMDDPGERKRMAQAGRARARELFDARACASVLNGWFEEALSREAEPCASRA